MIADIHAHLLPGIDDGAADLDEALALAEAAVAEGVSWLALTPHHLNGFDNDAAAVERAVAAFRGELVRRGIPLEVAAGQEIRAHESLLDRLDRGELLSLGGSRYWLLELPHTHVPDFVDDLIHELLVAGRIPVIAHPERHPELARRPERLAGWVRAGAVGQATTHSLVGRFGEQTRLLTLEWCAQGLVHLVASDAHHVRGRAFAWKECLRALEEAFGDEAVRRCLANAARVCDDAEPAFERIAEGAGRKRRWFYGKFGNFLSRKLIDIRNSEE